MDQGWGQLGFALPKASIGDAIWSWGLPGAGRVNGSMELLGSNRGEGWGRGG